MYTAHRKSSHSLKRFQSKKTPCSRRLIVKLRTLFKTQDFDNHTLFSGTYPYRPNMGVAPLGLRYPPDRDLSSSQGYPPFQHLGPDFSTFSAKSYSGITCIDVETFLTSLSLSLSLSLSISQHKIQIFVIFVFLFYFGLSYNDYKHCACMIMTAKNVRASQPYFWQNYQTNKRGRKEIYFLHVYSSEWLSFDCFVLFLFFGGEGGHIRGQNFLDLHCIHVVVVVVVVFN